MRTIKFRGISVHDNYFVYGCLIKKRSGLFYIQDDTGLGSDIETDTIGQFTGLNDKNGAEVYEGDVLEDKNKTKWYCVYYYSAFVFSNDDLGLSTILRFYKDLEDAIVIGNIHQNQTTNENI